VLVDTVGLIIAVVVTDAAKGDREGLRTLQQKYFSKGGRRLRKFWVDGDYSGRALNQCVAGLKKTHKITIEIVERFGDGFQVVKRRLVGERTLAWLFNYRRHSKDYEVLTRSSEAMIQIMMIHNLVRRLV
jgi:putative transposase